MNGPANSFSASDAAIDGFRVIGERWRVVAGWSLFNLVALVAMVAITALMIFIVAATAGSEAQATSLGGVIGGVGGGLGTFLIEVIIVAALYRMLLRPDEPAFLHLRLGADEFRLLGVWLIVGVCAAALAGAGFVAATAVGQRAGFAAGLATGFGVMAVMIYLALRFALAAPMTFADRRFRFMASWRMTRGRVLPLLGMCALSLCLLLLIAIVGWIVLSLAIWAATGFNDLGLLSMSDPEHLTARPAAYLTQLAAQLLFAPFLWVISQAPLVAAYKAIARDT